MKTQIKQLETFVAENKEQQKKVLQQWFNGLFEQNPKAEMFFWNQYTDYFNDGEQCKFHVHPIAYATKASDGRNQEKEIWEHYGEAAYEGEEGFEVDDVEYGCAADIHDSKEKVNIQDLFRFAFGDHVQVVVYRDRVVVDSYTNHD